VRNILLFIIFITLLLVIGGVFINYVRESETTSIPQELLVAPEKIEYYWSETCPHCANVEEFMQGWESKEKIQMDKFEVNESVDNAQKFIARGTYCKIPRSKLGVPLLITPEGKCLTGDEPIIEYFKNLEL